MALLLADANLFIGYVTFKECQGVTNPTIGIELGESYIFAQEDISNWYHPLGFAYFPDGNHDNKPELDPTITQTGSSCVHNNSCPTPQYLQNGVVLGKPGTKDYGVDVYEPAFAVPLPEWAAAGNYSIELTFDDASYTSDIFYFCHVRTK